MSKQRSGSEEHKHARAENNNRGNTIKINLQSIKIASILFFFASLVENRTIDQRIYVVNDFRARDSDTNMAIFLTVFFSVVNFFQLIRSRRHHHRIRRRLFIDVNVNNPILNRSSKIFVKYGTATRILDGWTLTRTRPNNLI